MIADESRYRQMDSVAVDEPYIAALESLSAEVALPLEPCAIPDRAHQDTLMTEENLRAMGKTIAGWKPAMAHYLATIYELMPEPTRASDNRPVLKRWCCKGYRRIAAASHRADSATQDMLKAIEDAGLMVVIRPGEPTWPESAGDQGAMRAPVWGIFTEAAKRIGLQLALIATAHDAKTAPAAGALPPQPQARSAPVAGALLTGGKGGARTQRQQELQFERAEQRHLEVIQHVANTGDDVAAEIRRAMAMMLDALETGFTSLREFILKFFESHLRHGHDHGADGIQKNDENENEPCINFRREITRADLSDLWIVEEFFAIAIAQKPHKWQNTELDRITFFGLAIAARERDNAGGWFNNAVSNKWSSFAEKIDVQNRARAAVKEVLHGDDLQSERQP